MKIEHHPLSPFLPVNAQILMLGSFPPSQDRWSMEFYYPNFQNDMWRIMGLAFRQDKNYFVLPEQKTFDVKKIKDFLSEKGIALSDTAKSIIRQKENASDKYLEVVESFDLSELLSAIPQCTTIVTTGQKATDTILFAMEAPEPKMGGFSEFNFNRRKMKLYRMPSTSRAYPKPIEDKATIYKQMFYEIGLM
jgi:G:T/U-mismatch repair DNA glycosylase